MPEWGFRTAWSLKGGSAALTGHQGVQPVHGFLPEVRGLRALVQEFHAGVVPLHLGLMSLGGAILPSTLLGILPVGVLLYCSGALTPAQCGEFISRLEQGWDTPAGGKLSGGERQRIAIARAILKYAPVVILDEVTAFTDLENEAQLQCSIARLRALHLLLVFPGTEESRSLIRIAPFDGARYRNPAVGFHRRIFIRARAASACEPAAHRIPGRRNPGYPRG